MKIVADDAIPWLTEAFGELGEVVATPGPSIDAAAVADADVLVTRSVTTVDANLLEGSPLKLVVSATAGIDHVDLAALQTAGVAFEHAPGCNAQGVVEYVLTELLTAAADGGPGWLGRGPIGIIGFGQVGRRLAVVLRELGLQVVVNDPPLRAKLEAGELSGLSEEHVALVRTETFVPLRELLEQAAVVTLHVPRVEGGRWPTPHLLDAKALARIREDALVFNTSRGDVVDNAALRTWLDDGPGSAVLDVWEGEPKLDPSLVLHTSVRRATPHIAGYTVQGKARGTAMAHAAVCRHLQREVTFRAADVVDRLDEAPTPTVRTSDIHWLGALLRVHHDLAPTDAALRALAQDGAEALAAGFEGQRRGYDLRHELSARPRPEVPHVEQRVLSVRLDDVLSHLCPRTA
jgi:erythronate-4-phosphate dehydrogenase